MGQRWQKRNVKREWVYQSITESGPRQVVQTLKKVLDVKPRDSQDYVPVLGWLVSRRLALAVLLVLGLLSACYLGSTLPRGFLGGNGIPVYAYRALPLRFYTGTVQILGEGGYLAYVGQVADGFAEGTGTLYRPDGSVVYEGEFSNSMFHGTGTAYGQNGVAVYTGAFQNNVYHGQGTQYHTNGATAYKGSFVFGQRSGEGTLFNQVGKAVYQGNFLGNEIVYADSLGRATAEVAQHYLGDVTIYQSEMEYCVCMDEIDALYVAQDGSNTLENQWTVTEVYVLSSQVALENQTLTTIQQLQHYFGEPLYFGTAWAKLPEVVGWNRLAERQDIQPIQLEAQEGLTNVYTVSGYDRNAQMVLYTFEREGLLYTFYCTTAGQSEFVMYSIKQS